MKTSRFILAALAVSLALVAATPARAQVGKVQMKIAGYLCGN